MNNRLETQATSLPVLFCLVACVLLMACGQKSAETTAIPEKSAVEAPKTKAKAPAPTAVAQPKPKPEAAAATYTIRVVPGAAKAGVEVTSLIEISPLPGYKMNKDFPSRLKVAPHEGVTLTKPVLGKADADLSEAMLRFKVPFVVSAAGSADMSGTADFSVCNESSCKLYRGEQISWKVAVQ